MQLIVWPLLVVAVVASGYASVSVAPPEPEPVTIARAIEPAAVQVENPEPSTSTRGIVIYITQYGFEPREMTLPAGEYQLMIRNGSGRADLDVTVRGLASAATPGKTYLAPPGTTVDLPIPRSPRRTFVATVALREGTVTLDEPEHRGWSCRINVTRSTRE